MSEWLKEHAWKACVGETLPWVRIPLSPPRSRQTKLLERCQSGRMGRSRKPLTGQPVRGFESHPLRHSLSFRSERAVLDALAPSDLLYGFRSTRRAGPRGPAIPRNITSALDKAVLRENRFSAQQT